MLVYIIVVVRKNHC